MGFPEPVNRLVDKFQWPIVAVENVRPGAVYFVGLSETFFVGHGALKRTLIISE
jgi:hypothetical protein